jgi:hypothetical protein
MDCGELCVEYNDKEGYILFAFDKSLKTYYYSTKDTEDFKYTVFYHLCLHNGFEYELSYKTISLYTINELVLLLTNLLASITDYGPYDLVNVSCENVNVSIKIR